MRDEASGGDSGFNAMADWPVPTIPPAGAILKAGGAGDYLLPAGPNVGIVMTPGADAYGAYVQFRSASGNACYLKGVISAVSANLAYQQIEVGTGGAGSETSVGEYKTGSNGNTIPPIVVWPWVPIPAGTRIAAKQSNQNGNGANLTLSLIDQANVTVGS